MVEEKVLPALAATLGALFAVYAVRKWTRNSGGLPGPMGWPVIGYMPYLDPRSLYSTMKYLIEKYGPIFKLRLGSYDTIVITDYLLIKKAFRSQELAHRPSLQFFEFASQGYHGLASSSGELWNEQRRFALRHLRDLGMGKSSIGIHIEREAICMIEILRKSVGEPIDLNNSLNIAITNIVWAIVAGCRMEYDDPLFLGLMAAIRRNMEISTKMGIVGFIPWLKNILPRSWLGINLMEESVEAVNSYFKTLIASHKESFDRNDMRDYTDYFINEQLRQGENSTYTDTQLVVSMGDLFVAGGETTATTLRWAILLLSHFPDVQQKVQAEIDTIVGKERRPTLEDRELMPYTDAVIYEIQRFADIAPMGVFHASTEDYQFEGYNIPKGTMVMGYVGGIHRSKKYWAKPDEFYPEHFLDENGLLRKNVEGFLPFSIGKRQCLGENLARAELFIFVTYFFQIFNFTLCTEPKPSLNADPRGGIVRWPSPYRVVLKSR